MFVLLLGTLCLLVLIKAVWNYSYWARHGVPNRPYPILSWLYKSFDKYLVELQVPQHKVAGGFMFWRKFLTVNDPQIARDLSIKEMNKFPLRFDIHIGETILAKSLFFLEANNDWKRIRGIVSPSFSSGKLKAMMEPINEIADQLVANLRSHAQKGEPFDVKRYLDGFTMDVITRCAYGVHLNSVSEPNHPIITNAKKILNINVTFQQAICILLPDFAKLLNLSFFDDSAVKYFDDLTNAILDKRKQAKQNYNDLIGLMMKEFENGNDSISSSEISAQSILFFIAGYDTTNATFDHVLYFLGRHPEWQDRLYEELKENKLDYDKLAEYPVLNAVINETMRLKPSLSIINRVAKEDCYLLDTGIAIEEGTTLSIQPYVIHRDPDYFEDPDEFKPERFIGTGLENSIAFMPFGAGPRFCVGMRFAMNELRIGVAKFFKNYKVEIPPKFEIQYFRGSVLLSPIKLEIILNERRE